MIKITIQNYQGIIGHYTNDLKAWQEMAPVAKILDIHEKCRDVTKGQPFEIIREITN